MASWLNEYIKLPKYVAIRPFHMYCGSQKKGVEVQSKQSN